MLILKLAGQITGLVKKSAVWEIKFWSKQS